MIDKTDASALCLRAVKTYRRAETDGFAEMAAALGVCAPEDWPGASKWAGKRDSHKIAGRIWGWGIKRWSLKVWLAVEYQTRKVVR